MCDQVFIAKRSNMSLKNDSLQPSWGQASLLYLNSQIDDISRYSHLISELVLEITQFCPQNCIFCSSNAGPRRKLNLDLEKIYQIISDAKALHIQSIHLSGGEPLSHPDIIPILYQLFKYNFEIIVYSCGLGYNSKGISVIPEDLIKIMSKIKNCRIRFNFQSSIEKNFENITRTRGSYKIALSSLKMFKKYQIPIEAHIVPTLLNLTELEKTINFLLKEGVEKVKILRFIPQGRGLKNRELVDPDFNPEMYKQVLQSIKNHFSPNQVEIGSAFSCLSSSSDFCTAGIKKLAITPMNELFPCVAFKTLHGTPLNEKSLFNTIKNNNFLDNLRKISATKCEDCGRKNDCDEICPRQIMLCKNFLPNFKNPILTISKTIRNNN